eukprot:TRINITY_DN3613_c0_g1_i2.p1 TRINITY_DN3613_c0_g1~~TRINITY_DN3613_c0_g1_i2.p1  ORF type:complete len:109 (+),score=33.62 TRINITY_DN3613_c0_g1_i2:64-390(+)
MCIRDRRRVHGSVLVGNKIDLENEIKVTQKEVEEFLAEIGEPLPYFEVSAKLNQNINEVFLQVSRDVLQNFFGPNSQKDQMTSSGPTSSKIVNIDPPPKNETSSSKCC